MKKINGISFFCPAYYDGDNIADVIDKAISVFSKTCEDYEIVVINDGSPDNAGQVLNRLANEHDRIKVIHHPYNMGYAQALKTGFKNANKFECILFTDGDNQYDIEYFKDMIKYIDDYDAVISYRTENANSFIRRIISRLFNMTLNIMFNEPFTDLSSAFRLVKRKAVNEIDQCKSTNIFFPVELILRLHKKNFKIKEIPIKTKKRLHGRSSTFLPQNVISVIIDMYKLKKNLI